MRKILTAAAVAFGIGAASGPVFAEGAGMITVTGEGMVSAAPDMASVSLGVTTLADTAAEAMTQNNAAMQAVMDRLAAAGIEPRDLQTSNLQLQPNWVQEDSMQTPEIRGYMASNMLTARVRDLAILGGVVDAAVKDGANTLNGLSFEQANPKPAQSEARIAAVKDASAKAAELVTAAGASLGKIVSISENGGYVSPMPMVKAAMDESSVPIAGGEIGVSAQVTVVFEIVQ
jgi:uncharacterized protein YggE